MNNNYNQQNTNYRCPAPVNPLRRRYAQIIQSRREKEKRKKTITIILSVILIIVSLLIFMKATGKPLPDNITKYTKKITEYIPESIKSKFIKGSNETSVTPEESSINEVPKTSPPLTANLSNSFVIDSSIKDCDLSDNVMNEIQTVINLVNEERSNQGLSELSTSQLLTEAATARSKEIITLFDHTRPNGETCFSIFKEYNIPEPAGGENIAAGQRSANEVVEAWMNSEGHKKNILNSNFKKIGVGLVIDTKNNYHYWTQLFTY